MMEHDERSIRVPATESSFPGESAPRGTRRRHWGARCLLFFLSQFLVLMAGCTSLQGVRDYLDYNDATNDFVMGWRNRVWARQAWHRRAAEFACEPQFTSFGEGFREGYAAVAGGGDGCVPVLPPRRYWTWRYQTLEGQAKVAAWYAGYPYGAAAAKEDGAGNFQEIQVSSLIEAQYSPEFQHGICPCEYDGHYPDWFPPEYLPQLDSQGLGPSPAGVPQEVQGSGLRNPNRDQQTSSWIPAAAPLSAAHATQPTVYFVAPPQSGAHVGVIGSELPRVPGAEIRPTAAQMPLPPGMR